MYTSGFGPFSQGGKLEHRFQGHGEAATLKTAPTLKPIAAQGIMVIPF